MRVGDRVITADEFRLSYEFGHGHLRRGENPRRTYLELMIYEKLLALEAEKIRLDTAAAIVHATRTLREELLIEKVFEEQVLSRIEVTDEEVRSEVNRSEVSVQFRFIPAVSEAEARAAREAVAARGFDAVLEEKLDAFRDLDVPVGEVTSPFVKAEEIDPVILAAIQELPLGVPSEPVAYGGMWYVFEVMNIRRQRLAEVDYEARAPSVRKVLYNRKAMELETRFVAATMEPRNVVTKRQGFEVLAAALWQWYGDEVPLRNPLHYLDGERREAALRRAVEAALRRAARHLRRRDVDHPAVARALHAGPLRAPRRRAGGLPGAAR